MMPKPWQTLAYCASNVVAILAALYIAFWLDLDRPYWAMFTVFIVSQPISGAVRAKAVFRFAGTLAGAAMSVFLVPPLVQSPLLLCLAVSGWIAFCLYAALQDRTPRSYAFLLSGYSVAIVGLSTVNAPTAVYDVALSRFEEITIGIICATIAHSVFFPLNLGEVLRSKAEWAIRRSAGIAAKALAAPASAPSVEDVAAVAETVTELHRLYSQIGFETSNVPRVPAVMAALLDRLAVIVPSASLMVQAVRGAGDAMPGPAGATLDGAAAVFVAIAAGRPADIDGAIADLEAEIEALAEEELRDNILSAIAALRFAETILETLRDVAALATALNDRSVLRSVSGLLTGNLKRPLYNDKVLALLSAAAAAGSVLVTCSLWIYNAWPEGFVAAQFAAIVCCLFATQDGPSEVIGKAVIGILVALPFGALYEFAILPRTDGFVSLALVLSPMLLLLSYMQTSEKLEGAGQVLAIAFSGALALQESFAADFASFVNSNLAEIIGPLIAIAMLLIFRTIDPAWNARRIWRSGRSAVSDLARGADGMSQGWPLQMFDRIGLSATRLASVAKDRLEPDLLQDLRVGLNVSTLHQVAPEVPAVVRAAIRRVADAIAELYASDEGASRPSAPEIRNKLATLSELLVQSHSSEDRMRGLVAVCSLRADLSAGSHAVRPA